jgi:aldehyde dehydrogenase
MERCLERIGRIVQGNPLDRSTMMGPQVSKAQLEKIESYVKIGVDEGAELLCGGERFVPEEEFVGGYYYAPTVLKGDNSMRVFQEEIFGPVVAAIPFESEEELIQLANESSYGLAAGVWTNDVTKALRITDALNVGTVWINTYSIVDAALPFGGYKQSGWGRESGREGVELYTETKSVCIQY